MRLFLVFALVAGGCGDDTTVASDDLGAGGDDLSTSADDLAGTGDMTCVYESFNGFGGASTKPAYVYCPCGCSIDPMESSTVNPMWSYSYAFNGSTFVPIPGVGLGADLDYSDGMNGGVGLNSTGPVMSQQFYLDGDFDLSVDYNLVTAPPGPALLFVAVSDPMTMQGVGVEREIRLDGSSYYTTTQTGFPSRSVPATATQGTLRITRHHVMVTTYGDGQTVTTLSVGSAPRVAIFMGASLYGCAFSDGGASCSYQPRFHNMRLASGTLVSAAQ